jgi:glycosyltransferase involved in cell wall biosynthesis
MSERCVAVLGWRDEPTDAVEEYCCYLGAALSKQGIELEIIRVRWPEIGWTKALEELQKRISALQVSWFLVQYTALGWSRRGFPLEVSRLIRVLKKSGARCGVVFHDPEPYPGDRLVDRFRRTVQLRIMRSVARLADLTVLTVAVEKTPWIPKDLRNVRFIPVGANLPNPDAAWRTKNEHRNTIPTIAVYSISDGAPGRIETSRIAAAARFVSKSMGRVRLSVLGRNSDRSGRQLKEELADCDIELAIHGLLKPEDVVSVLGSSDVLLFARGPISSRRGSALAGIACGLPVVACEGWETAPPVTEAGVVLLPDRSENTLGPALFRVLTDDALRESLAERSRMAQSRYFSWARIAARYEAVLSETAKG